MRYIKGTTKFGIQYTLGASQLVGFTNSDWASFIDYQKSTSRFVYRLGFSLVA